MQDLGELFWSIIWTALRFFFASFFSSFSYRRFLLLLVFLSQASYLSHNRLFLDFFEFCFTFFGFLVYVLD